MGTAQLKDLGWRQGAILPEEIAKTIVGDEDCAPGTRLIVISHDCDVTNASLDKEPMVELLPAEPAQPGDPDGGNYTWGKNQRIYQLELKDREGKRPYRVSVHKRILRSREILVNYRPDDSTSIAANDVEGLARWLSKRYWRSALPDEFNLRRAPANDKIKGALKRGGDPISSLLAAVEREEKSLGDPYVIMLQAVMTVEKHSQVALRDVAEAALNEITVALNDCDGIQVQDAGVVSEAQVSIDDLRYLHVLDEFDNQSLRQDPVGDISEH